MADVHLFGGEKGGIGKSFVCRTAIQYLLDREEVFALFDTDRSNPDVRRIYNEAGCRVAVFSEGERYEDKANAIYNAALEKRVLVNLPAQVFIPVSEWFERNELLSIASDDGVKFFYWFVCDGGYDSLKLLGKSLEFFKSDVPHILVKNWGKCDDWEPLENDEDLQSLMAQYEVMVIDFPKFIGNADRNAIDAASLSFGEAREYERFGSISRQRVKRFLREAYEAFDEAGVFQSVPSFTATKNG
ncbi:hypothetical protein HC931_17580 [Candidatus Gracilibacteria bacterium]|nr:hypothetical protein [Candidatus Gracilibacteria bacterium]